MKKTIISILLSFVCIIAFALPGQIGFFQNATGGGGTPTVTSRTLQQNNDGTNTLAIGLSESCSIGAGGSGGMAATPSGGSATLGTVSGLPGLTASYAITDRYILSSETITATYTQPGNGIEATTGGIDLASFTTQSVTNNSKVIAYDLYNRANGALGANYSTYAGTNALAIVSNQVSWTAASGSDYAGFNYTATVPTANASVTVTLRTAPSTAVTAGLGLRQDGAGDLAYTAYIANTTTSIHNEIAGTVLNGGAASATVTWSSGDKFTFAVSGTTFTVYKNGVSVVSGTDSNYSTAHAASYLLGANSGTPTFAIDDLVIQNL